MIRILSPDPCSVPLHDHVDAQRLADFQQGLLLVHLGGGFRPSYMDVLQLKEFGRKSLLDTLRQVAELRFIAEHLQRQDGDIAAAFECGGTPETPEVPPCSRSCLRKSCAGPRNRERQHRERAMTPPTTQIHALDPVNSGI